MQSSQRELVSRHVRRYGPFYVFAVFGLLAVTIAPTVNNTEATGDIEFTAGAPEAAGDFDPSTGGSGQAAEELNETQRPDPANGTDAGAETAPTAAQAPASAPTGNTPRSAAGSGTTRGGFDCNPGVRQLPWSEYAAPCVPIFDGDNGGQTARGVSAESIRVVIRGYASDSNNSALDAVLAQAGVDREENRRRQQTFIKYFNEVYELYGRQVEVVNFTSNANQFDEVNGRGREQACADATRIAQEMNAFAVLPADGIAYGPFTECAAERRLFQPIGAYGFPQEFYARLHPYVWGVQMNCTRINTLYAEYIVKRLAGSPATYPKDAAYKGQPRRIGIIQPDIEYYFPCIRLLQEELARQGVEIVSTFDYLLDPATLPAQMNRAVVQFKADRVTTLLSVADFLTMINLTQAAASQGWGPEWVLQGSGLQDNYAFARLYDQSVVDGHMFGMSQTGDSAAIYGPDSELVRSYKEATGETLEPPETGNYFELIHMFNQLQGAGPNLTAQTAADGTFSLPPSGASPAAGIWNFGVLSDGQRGFQHTASTDAREVFWDRRATGPDGSGGDFVSVLDGRRFGVGQWPRGTPKR